MRFFIPAAKDEKHGQEIFNAIKRFLGEELGAQFDDRKIFNISYTHDGKEYYAEVGKLHQLNGEPVVAILYEPIRKLYHVCTTNRGVVSGGSMLVGAHSVISYEDFEAD